MAFLKALGTITLPRDALERVGTRLRQIESWADWMDGVEVVEILSRSGSRAEIVLMVQGPRAFRLSLAIDFKEDGLEYGLLEGPFSCLNGSIRVSQENEAVTWDIELRGLTYLSNALTRDLSDVVIPAWLSGLVEEVA